jgi:hypothetical protein
MKRLHIACLLIILVFLLSPALAAEKKNTGAVTVVVPADSIAQFIMPLLPYRIDAGENFRGAMWVKSIENIKIKNNQIFFSTHIYGKDIKYVAKVQKREVSLLLGGVDLHNNWQASLRYDQNKKMLFIKPHIDTPGNEKELSQGDVVLNTLLMALSDLEYPVEINDLKPIMHEFNKKMLTISMSIYDVYTKNNKLFISIVPAPRIDDGMGN